MKYGWRSRCCDALPIGEMSQEHTGFCSKCKENCIFEKVKI